MLAAPIGVNIGPNLTYVGSLANLLWRRVLLRHDVDAPPLELLRAAALTVPAALALAVGALWLALSLGV